MELINLSMSFENPVSIKSEKERRGEWYDTTSFSEVFKKVSGGQTPKAGDFYYHEERRESGADCSVHEINDHRFMRIPVDPREDATITEEDIRGQDIPKSGEPEIMPSHSGGSPRV